jgi:4-amino-4-deoxy-L-arabinose transferase-like glycosyltransferase
MVGFWLYGLTDMDEGFYGAVVAEMNRRAEWITPIYNGKPWFEKPILLYWLTKPSLALFGGEFGLRLPSVLATLALYAVVAWFVNRRVSTRAAQWSVLVLGTSLLTVAIGRMVMTDALLCLCLSAALLTFYESLVGDRRWRLASAFLLGLSVLAKGPVGCALFALIVAVTYWREAGLRSAFRGWWAAGIGIFIATVACWYMPAYLTNGDAFVQEFLVKQNLQRFAGGDAAHTLHGPAGWFFYVPILIAGTLPWTFWIWPALKGRGTSEEGRATVEAGAEDTDERRGATDAGVLDTERNRGCEPSAAGREWQSVSRFLITWAVVVILFFSAAGAKLIHYVLPAIPPLAILVGGYWSRRERRRPSYGVPCGAAVAAVVLCIAVNVGMVAWDRGMFKGSAPEVQARAFANEVRILLASHPDAGVAIYKMGRQSKDMGTGKLKVQETNLPSLLFYLDLDVLETDDFGAVLQAPRPLYILTRAGRIGGAETQSAAGCLKEAESTDFFALWVLEPKPHIRGSRL